MFAHYISMIKLLHRNVRQITYEGMAHQASDWVPEELRKEKEASNAKPIKINFNVAKRNRLHWIRRTL